MLVDVVAKPATLMLKINSRRDDDVDVRIGDLESHIIGEADEMRLCGDLSNVLGGFQRALARILWSNEAWKDYVVF
jgi:hypothetical protein